ncbi:Hypothetical protein KVN_LOCUS38 [uncultured virus]|nr:Hypothetical protein KVN_LOCUS38 [uncultured virus]
MTDEILILSKDKSIKYDLFNNTVDDETYEEIKILVFNKINSFEKLGSWSSKGDIVIGSENYYNTKFKKGNYFIYNLDGCLLLSKINIEKKDIMNQVFKFSGLTFCIGINHFLGIYDESLLSLIDNNCKNIPNFSENFYKNNFIEAKKVLTTSFEKKINSEEKTVGYVIDAMCRSNLYLPCLENDNCLLLINGDIIEKIFGS